MNVIIVKDTNGYIFGGFFSQEWKCLRSCETFYGTGESYLFSF